MKFKSKEREAKSGGRWGRTHRKIVPRLKAIAAEMQAKGYLISHEGVSGILRAGGLTGPSPAPKKEGRILSFATNE